MSPPIADQGNGASPRLDQVILEASGLSRSFGPIEVLSDISISVRAGEVHAIIGENGAGKSTLMKILSGHLTPSRGTVKLDGALIELKGPVDAERRGIVLVHQEIMLAPDLSIAENMFLGHELRRGLLNYLPIGFVVGVVLLAELLLVVGAMVIEPGVPKTITAPIAADISNTQALGEVLYTRYFYFFQAAGMILLTAMIGAIVLTLHHKQGVKRQDIGAQVARTPETAVEVRKVPSRAGI